MKTFALFMLLCFELQAASNLPERLPAGRYGNVRIDTAGCLQSVADEKIRTFETGKTPTAFLYVSLDGNDNDPGTETQPFRTLAKAVRSATPGTAIRIFPGVYTPSENRSHCLYSENMRGFAEAPLWIGGIPGHERPTLSGASSDAVHIAKGQYIVFHDFEIQNVGGNGLNFDDGGEYNDTTAASNVVFRNIRIHGVGSGGNQDCLKLSGLNNFYIFGCEISDEGGNLQGSGIDMVGCHNGFIFNNYCHNLSANAVQTKGGSTNVKITQNLFFNCGERSINIGGSTGNTFFRPPLSQEGINYEAVNLLVSENIIIGSNAPFAFVSASRCAFANNTVVRPARFLMRILQEGNVNGKCADNTIADNIFYYDSDIAPQWRIINISQGTMPETFTITGNLFYNADTPSLQPSFPDNVTVENSITGKNPMFVGEFDFHLQADSPAKGKGMIFREQD
jgi:hypothetical protein